MSTDPKKNKDELTDDQSEKIAGGRGFGGTNEDSPPKYPTTPSSGEENPDLRSPTTE